MSDTTWTPFEKCTPVRMFGKPIDDDVMLKLRLLEQLVFKNNIYQVVVNKMASSEKFPEHAHLSIKSLDGSARHDWRDFQRIKNELVGPEHEAVELYPAESRLVDASNQYHLVVLPAGMKFPFGYQDRLVSESKNLPGVNQRPWIDSERPSDCTEMTMDELIRDAAASYNKAKSDE